MEKKEEDGDEKRRRRSTEIPTALISSEQFRSYGRRSNLHFLDGMLLLK